MEPVRLSKVMAQRGICSRREADEYISRSLVRVDGRVISELGTRIDPEARIDLLPGAVEHQERQVTILLNKPIGFVSAQPEDGHRAAVELFVPENQWDRDPDRRRWTRAMTLGMAPAGRLDIDSQGMLILTQDGRVARRIIDKTSPVEKEYLVRVQGRLDDRGLALLRHGLSLDEQPLKPARVEWLNDDQLRFVLTEGKKRQIRRMCELVGLRVTGLKRVRIGNIVLGHLPEGRWRHLGPDERF